MSLALYLDRLRRLQVNVARGRASPHKICMLLAVLDLARSGALRENRIDFAPALLERYGTYFGAVRTERDHANPHFPFFHLQGKLRGGGESFWHLKAKPGREAVVAAMDGARGVRQITDNIDFAYLDPELFELLQDPVAVDALSAELAQAWFGRGLQDLQAVVGRTQEISRYERRLRNPECAVPSVAESMPSYIRDPAFRRVVTEIYDYRCAATGLRLVLPDGAAMVEAAHIPVQRSRRRRPAKRPRAHPRHALGHGQVSDRAGYRLPLAGQPQHRWTDPGLPRPHRAGRQAAFPAAGGTDVSEAGSDRVEVGAAGAVRRCGVAERAPPNRPERPLRL